MFMLRLILLLSITLWCVAPPSRADVRGAPKPDTTPQAKPAASHIVKAADAKSVRPKDAGKSKAQLDRHNDTPDETGSKSVSDDATTLTATPTAGADLSDRVSKVEDAVKNLKNSPPPPPSLPQALRIGLIAIGAVALGSLGLGLFVLLSTREKKRAEDQPQLFSSTIDTKDIDQRFSEVERRAEEALSKAGRNGEQSSTYQTRFADIESDLTEMRQTLSGMRDALRDAPRAAVETLRSDFGAVSQAIAETMHVPALHRPGVVSARTVEGSAEALAASVNEWLGKRGEKRTSLLEYAKRAGLENVQLATLETSSSPSSFEYSFRATDDGSWLWASVPGSNDMWAAPADAQFMGMGSMPMLLNQLMDGMDGAQPGFRFAALYRPCRLRASMGRRGAYTLEERGLLQLEGNLPPSTGKLPELSMFANTRASGAFEKDGGGMQAGAALAAWIQRITRQLEDLGRDLGDLQESATEARRSGPTSMEGDVARLTRELANARREQERLTADNRRFDEQLRHLSERFAPPAATPSAHAPAQGEPASDTEVRPPAQLDTEKPSEPIAAEPLKKNQKSASKTLSANSLPSPTATPLPPLAPETLPSQEPEQSPPSPVPQTVSVWQRALAADGYSANEAADVPTPEVFLQRVYHLHRALQKSVPDGSFAVVHVMRRPGSNILVEVHNTDQDGEGKTVCRVCNTHHVWQLAVCAGVPGDEQLRVLLPAGKLSKGNYASGYSTLIGDVPSGSFVVTTSEEPATLQRVDRIGPVYTITRKLELNSTVPAPLA